MIKAPTKPRKPNRKGRPPVGEVAMGTAQPVRFPEPLKQAIEAEIDLRLDRPSFGAMVRELTAEAITARKAKRGER